MRHRFLLLLMVLLADGFSVVAQRQQSDKSELKIDLSEGGDHYLKFTFLNQVWLRYNQSNPGTTVLGEQKESTSDIGLRRTRIQFFGQISDHVFLYTQFGQNNFNYLSQTAGNRKIQAFFHDALSEFKVWKNNDWLKLGAGLTITNGLSRFSQPSIGSIMTTDVPVFAQATVDQTDEFSRKLSVYARGQIHRLDYRIAISDPFPVSTNGQTQSFIGDNATFAQIGNRKQYQGLFIWNFYSSEPNTTPYMTGTYLGKKKVLNLEAGFITQPDATWTVGNILPDFHDMNLFSAAVYYDAPLEVDKGTAISAYAGYFFTDYGPGYLRYNGIMNPADGINGAAGAGRQGNSFPMFGTGQVLYGQAGYLFKNDLLGDLGTLQPYASIQYALFDRLPEAMNVYNFGVNWIINGHTSKISVDLQSRPVYETQGPDLSQSGRKGQLVFQYQVYF